MSVVELIAPALMRPFAAFSPLTLIQRHLCCWFIASRSFQTAPCGNGRTKRTKRTKRGLIATPVNATLGVDLILPSPLGTILSPLSSFLSAGYGQKIILGSGIGAARSTRPTSERIIPRRRAKGAEQFLYALRRRQNAIRCRTLRAAPGLVISIRPAVVALRMRSVSTCREPRPRAVAIWS